MSAPRQPTLTPADIARIALKRLGELGLPPTPENYGKFYNAIATLKSPTDRSAEELQSAYQVLFRVSALLDNVTETTDSLLSGLERGGERLTESLGILEGDSENEVDLGALVRAIMDSTTMMCETATASQRDLQEIKSTMQTMQRDLSQNRRSMESDPLTGALNRQGLENTLLREVKRAHRYNSPFSLVLADLDDFTNLNERLGPLIGDKVLLHFVSLTRSGLRESDSLVRYGCDEFLLLLPETDINGARFLLNRMRQITQKTPFLYQHQRIDLRFCACYGQLGSEETGMAFISRMDNAMFTAKRSGRDSTVQAEPALTQA